MFLVIEGIEGAGKTTASNLIRKELEDSGIEVIHSREPGGTELGEEIRRLLLNPNTTMKKEATLLLYMAARAHNLTEKIEPALEEGKVVLCDRYFDSTVAYQGIGQGMGEQFCRDLHETVFGNRRNNGNPDYVIILLVSPKVSRERVASRGETLDRFEKEKYTFFKKVHTYYLGLRERSLRGETILKGTTYYFVDAERSIEQVSAEIKEILRQLMHNRGMKNAQVS